MVDDKDASASTSPIVGRLEYLGWHRPWMVSCDDAGQPHATDIRPIVIGALRAVAGQPAELALTSDGATIRVNEDAEHRFAALPEAEDDTIPLLRARAGVFGFTNVSAYLAERLTWLNGRRVHVAIAAASVSIGADPGDTVLGVYYDVGNTGRVDEATAGSVCGMATDRCCAFLGVDGPRFICLKFSSYAPALLERIASRTATARRIGDCAIVGRVPEATAA